MHYKREDQRVKKNSFLRNKQLVERSY